VKAYVSTDWIEVHDHGSVYEARVFLTNDDNAYMITVRNGKKRFFKVDANLLKSGELKFFEKVMESAEEISVEHAHNLGFLQKGRNGE
jgi:hypothetical protein